MDIKQKTEEVEKELLDVIVSHLRENKIDVRKASKLAQAFLAVLPMESQEDLLKKLKGLSGEYSEVKFVYLQELANDAKDRDAQALAQMQGAIREGNIEHAISVAKSLSEKV